MSRFCWSLSVSFLLAHIDRITFYYISILLSSYFLKEGGVAHFQEFNNNIEPKLRDGRFIEPLSISKKDLAFSVSLKFFL